MENDDRPHDVKRAKRKLKRTQKKKNKFAYTNMIIAGSAIGTTTLLLAGLPDLAPGSGALTNIKFVTLAIGGGIIGYGVNRLALERGAPLAAIGYKSAALASVASIAIIGGGLWASTYPAMTYRPVANLQLQEYATRLEQAQTFANQKANESARVIPVALSIENELASYAQCEIDSGCINEKGAAGYGTFAKLLKELAGRAGHIAKTLHGGEDRKIEALEKLNLLSRDYQEVFHQSDKSVWEKRGELQTIAAEAKQVISELDEAIPVDVVRGYQKELAEGVTVSGRPTGTRRLNDILQTQADRLKAVLQTLEDETRELDEFPQRPGVWETFKYMLHFLPLAAIAAVVELIFPLALWIYTFLHLRWILDREDDEPQPEEPEDPFFGLLPPDKPDNGGNNAPTNDAIANNVETLPEIQPRERKGGRRYPPRAGHGGQ